MKTNKLIISLFVLGILITGSKLQAASSFDSGCTAGLAYSSKTGQYCGCLVGEIYNPRTGQKCSSIVKPTIVGIIGPQVIYAGQAGLWQVKASSLNGGILNYSVIWGDEKKKTCTSWTKCAVSEGIIQTSPVFTHTYLKPGNYTPTFTVINKNNTRCVKFPCSSVREKSEITTRVQVRISNGCMNGEIYSSTTGKKCPTTQEKGCIPGEIYSSKTGLKC